MHRLSWNRRPSLHASSRTWDKPVKAGASQSTACSTAFHQIFDRMSSAALSVADPATVACSWGRALPRATYTARPCGSPCFPQRRQLRWAAGRSRVQSSSCCSRLLLHCSALDQPRGSSSVQALDDDERRARLKVSPSLPATAAPVPVTPSCTVAPLGPFVLPSVARDSGSSRPGHSGQLLHMQSRCSRLPPRPTVARLKLLTATPQEQGSVRTSLPIVGAWFRGHS